MVKPSVLPAFLALGWVLVSLVTSVLAALGLTLSLGVDAAELDQADVPHWVMAVGFLWMSVSLFGGAYGFGLLRGRPRQDLALGRIQSWPAVIAALLLNLALMRQFWNFRHPPESLNSPGELEHMVTTASPESFLLLLGALTALSLSYELLLRGFVLRRLAERWSLAVAVGILVAFDAMADFGSLQMVCAGALALSASLAAWRARSTWAAVLVMVIPAALDLIALRAGNPFEGRASPLLNLVVWGVGGWLVREAWRHRATEPKERAATDASAAASDQSSPTNRTS